MGGIVSVFGQREAVINAIGKAVFDGFRWRQEALRVHQLFEVRALCAGAGLVDVENGPVEAFEQVGRFPEVVTVADDGAPGIVHHHEGAEAHHDVIAGGLGVA